MSTSMPTCDPCATATRDLPCHQVQMLPFSPSRRNVVLVHGFGTGNANYMGALGALAAAANVYAVEWLGWAALRVAVTHGRHTWPLHMVVTHGRYTWPLRMIVTHGRYSWPLHMVGVASVGVAAACDRRL